MHGNQSGPVDDRRRDPGRTASSAGPATAPRSNDEAIDPLAYLMYAGAYNGVAMGVHRRRAAPRHAQGARAVRPPRWPTTRRSQDAFGRAVCEAQASRLFAYSFAKALDDATDDGSWEMYERDPT